MIARRHPVKKLPAIALSPENFQVLLSAKDYRANLIELIRNATQRIYIVALYLEDDEAGREILTEIYEAKQRNPGLDIQICVDWHRAQRGRLGAGATQGNSAMYAEFANKYSHSIPTYGVPVRGREVFGVLHLKGFIIDDTVLYSGASINNVYLHKQDRYRFDRYHIIESEQLADSMVRFITEDMIAHPAVHDLTKEDKPKTKDIKLDIRQFRTSLGQSYYSFEPQEASESQIGVTPLVGIGKRRNFLNQTIIQMIAQAKEEIFICTPYFNFPKGVAKEVKKAIRRGVKVDIVIGDKTANDFYISPEQPFKTIGGLPYLYEINLRRFAKMNESNIASRQLSIHLWKHDDNSFHLKGMWVDKRYMLLTGNNINPRAWKLDLENGLLIKDEHQHLVEQFTAEKDNILQHTQLICTYKQIEKLEDYPLPVQRLVRKITRVRADRVLKQIL
ncbi:CDP-diacylglycerol--serine O-phosphatidyltransferase [Vibrio palustris]|uniref:CDP-diacylglycerol--serine O-phosphatidyltransferase n=1 Tax=Vibrio palustris TaxID=1918946 RepID=A0A1R4B8Z0_9VIBR|nr:CDP-diacylglycerol--serine O-phosphatidyltransferase [Vibrio palustris]SJL85394.1 CDP-diacylglycerol--serine O-phosphatidyltransferase [Vibrio palustris]